MFAEHLVTVLVVDIQSFTKITQQIGQELLCSFVSRWFSDAARIFRAHGSWTLKYIGDAVMAVWLHKPDEDHRLQVLSGLAAVAEFAEISSADRYSLPVPLSFCAGFNTGAASFGNPGSTNYADFTVFGEVVNAAFRIEASTRQIGSDVAIGDHTAEILGGPSRVNSYLLEHSILLKGYSQPMRIWSGSFANLRELHRSR
jgi:adenylate cyclase